MIISLSILSRKAALLPCLLLLPATSVMSATLADADTLWKFDHANSGAANSAQVVDSSLKGAIAITSTSNFNNLSWTTVPPTGPAGGTAVDTIARGLQFTPVVTTARPGVGGGGNPDATTNLHDTVSAATFQASNANITGSSAIVMRLRWDGRIANMDDNPGYHWLVNNGYGGAGNGFLFGITSTNLTTGTLQLLTNGVGATNANSTSSFSIIKDVWYDIAIVLDDHGDSNLATGTVSFYAYSAANGLQTSSTLNAYVNTTSNTTLTVGSEQPGTGDINHRKSFHGAIDYLALFDQSLTQTEVSSIFAAPEPGRALLLCFAMIGFLTHRQRRISR